MGHGKRPIPKVWDNTWGSAQGGFFGPLMMGIQWAQQALNGVALSVVAVLVRLGATRQARVAAAPAGGGGCGCGCGYSQVLPTEGVRSRRTGVDVRGVKLDIDEWLGLTAPGATARV